jgi:3-deoxy-D-arabino-heptulosonate 7-phosphate (DAHP) synthase
LAQYGVSITDACVDFEDTTVAMLRGLAENVKARRVVDKTKSAVNGGGEE